MQNVPGADSGLTHDGRPLRMLAIVDEYTRECRAIEVGRRLNSQDVLHRLSDLFVQRGTPTYLRSDNGPELTVNCPGFSGDPVT